ncbi:hypothetical protein QP938_11415 [Porticoccaceae bacterium LTM1]|nr:hypothetical protein QP938_11415 [Porticoccaceae bacterium LTM1]
MHIILAFLGAVVTILVLLRQLDNAGIDFRALNPFWWYRRRKWQKQYHADPAFSLDNPMEATAGLMYVAAKCSGDISKEQKACLLSLFESEFHLSEREATELLASCAFLIKDEDKVREQLKKYLEPSISKFSLEQKESAIDLINRVINCEERIAEKQREFVEATTALMASTENVQASWR